MKRAVHVTHSITALSYFLYFNSLMSELNSSAQRCLPRFFTGILIFKRLTARRRYKSFGVERLNYNFCNCDFISWIVSFTLIILFFKFLYFYIVYFLPEDGRKIGRNM
jgi:hypothetical protein